MQTVHTILTSGLLYFFYNLRAMLRQAQYGIQVLFLPALGLTIFLAVFAAMKMVHGEVQALFYPFLIYNLLNFPLGLVMQVSYRIFINPSQSNVFLATPGALNTLLARFLGESWVALLGNLVGVVVAALMIRPTLYPLSGGLAMMILVVLLIPTIWLGLAAGLRLAFAHELSQFVFLGLFAILAIPTDMPWLWVAVPFTASLYLFQQAQILWQPFLYGMAGVALWWALSRWMLSIAYNHYRLGKGVDRR